MVRILAVYLRNAWNYDLYYFQTIFDGIERLSIEAMDKGYALVIVGDFNLFLERRDRGRILLDFCQHVLMDIANGDSAQEDIHSWTFKSSTGEGYRWDYTLDLKNDVPAKNHLDLGSNHRNVSTALELSCSRECWKKLTDIIQVMEIKI